MNEEVTIVYWRDIPAQVMSGNGRNAIRKPLSGRFQEAIDRAATRAGLVGSDEYTAEWRKETVTGDLTQVAADLEHEFAHELLEQLVRSGGSNRGR